jgi:iron-sulfur cluster repair protein YtfE (RIC family)
MSIVMNALELMKQQHEKTKTVLEKIHESGGTPTELKQLADELVAHMVIEEHIFYPRVKEIMGEMFGESFEEHAVARFELARLLQATPEEVKTRAMVLKELLEHHIEEEEQEMFPKVKRNLETEELELLGLRMKTAFDTAVAKGLEQFLEPPPSFMQRPTMNGAASVSMR